MSVGPAASAAKRFAFRGAVLSIRPLGDGHINDTFSVDCRDSTRRIWRYVLQRVNRTAFPDPIALIRNVERVTAHLRGKAKASGGAPDPCAPKTPQELRPLTPVPTQEGALHWVDPDGDVWRSFVRVVGVAYSVIQTPAHAYAVGRAFGRFLLWMSDFPASELETTLPSFHHTPTYLAALRDAVALDPCGRAKEAKREIAFAEARADVAPVLDELRASGAVPERVIHGDTKIDNVLVDEQTHAAVCVIDLDTVMRGISLFDIGDCVRSALTGGDGVEKTSGQLASGEIGIAGSIVSGYLEGSEDLLTATEIEKIGLSARVIALELGIRFLTDFVRGDVRFRTETSEQNLERAREQFALARRVQGSTHALTDLFGRREARWPARGGGEGSLQLD